MEPRKDVLSLALKPRIPVAKTFLGLKWDTQNTPFFIPNNENSTLNLRLEKINDATKSKRSDKIHRNKQPKWGYHWSVASMTGASTGGQPRFMKTNATSWELPQINTPKVAVYVSTICNMKYNKRSQQSRESQLKEVVESRSGPNSWVSLITYDHRNIINKLTHFSSNGKWLSDVPAGRCTKCPSAHPYLKTPDVHQNKPVHTTECWTPRASHTSTAIELSK